MESGATHLFQVVHDMLHPSAPGELDEIFQLRCDQFAVYITNKIDTVQMDLDSRLCLLWDEGKQWCHNGNTGPLSSMRPPTVPATSSENV